MAARFTDHKQSSRSTSLYTFVASGGASYRQGRPYRFRPGPTSGPTIRPGSQKSKISTEIFNMFNHMTFACYI